MPMGGAVFAGYMYGWAGLSPQPNSNARVSRVEEFIKVLRVWSNLCKCVQHSEAFDEFYSLPSRNGEGVTTCSRHDNKPLIN